MAMAALALAAKKPSRNLWPKTVRVFKIQPISPDARFDADLGVAWCSPGSIPIIPSIHCSCQLESYVKLSSKRNRSAATGASA